MCLDVTIATTFQTFLQVPVDILIVNWQFGEMVIPQNKEAWKYF